MRAARATSRFFFVAALAGLAGCFSLGRDAPPLQHYVLSAARTVEAQAAPDAAGVTLGMRRLDLAAYLATPMIVVRRGAHRIGTSEYHRWAEDLSHGISRAVASHLAGAAPIRAVNVAPWPVRTRHDYLLQLNVARFEGIAGAEPTAAAATGAVHVAASWELLRPADDAVLARGSTDFRQQAWRVGDYAALVTLLDEGLSAVARDVAACVQRLTAAMPLAPGDARPAPLECTP